MPKKHPAAPPATPIVFTRADPAELARFDPSSKICSANCGPHRDDPRTELERRFLCGDCHPGERAGPAAVRVTVSTPDGQPLAQWERDSAGRLVTSEPVERPQSAPAADRLLPTGNPKARQDGPKAQAGGPFSTVEIRDVTPADVEALRRVFLRVDIALGSDATAIAVPAEARPSSCGLTECAGRVECIRCAAAADELRASSAHAREAKRLVQQAFREGWVDGFAHVERILREIDALDRGSR